MPTQNAIAVISDIHSNLEALTAVMDELKSLEISEIVCLGDIVGYASDAKHCLNRIMESGCPVVMGNHDEAAWLTEPPFEFNQTARAGILHSSHNLTEAEKSWLGSLPRRLDINGITYLHASLEAPAEWNYVLSGDDAEAHFLEQTNHIAFCGHTHQPAVWFEASPGSPITLRKGKGIITLPMNGKVLVNVGSVGQPRDGDNRSCYVIYRPDLHTVEFRRAPYDIKLTKSKIIGADLPLLTAHRLSFGR